MKLIRKLSALLLAACLLVSALPAAFAAETAQSGAVPGSGLTWTLDQNGCLTISGSGAAPIFSSKEDQPWASCRTSVTEVWFDSPSHIRIPDLAYWFDGCSALVVAEIPAGVERIGTRAFADCPRLATVTFHYTTEPYSIAEDAFYLDSDTGAELRFSFQIGFPEMVEPLASYPWAASNRTKLLFGRAPSNGLLSLSGNEQAVVIGDCPRCGEYSLQGEYTTESHPHRDYNQCYKCGYTEYTGTTSTKNHGDGSYGSWTCPKCGDHTWVLESEEPATCTQNGSRTYSCYCGQTKTETVYASGHDYTYGGWEYEDETQHVRTGTCDVCGRGSTQHQDHTWTYGSWEPANAAQHKRSRSCAACSHTETEYGPHTDENGDGACDICGAQMTLAVTWDAATNGGTVGGQERMVTSVAPGFVPVPPSEEPVKTGHIFRGWYTSAAGGDLYSALPVTQTVTFYAQFEAARYNVTWKLGDGRALTTEQTYGEPIIFPEEPVRNGYAFLGWYTEEDGGGQLQPGALFLETEPVSYFARWERVTMFSVTVPAVLPVTVDELGAVYTASASIRNNSTAAVRIAGVTVQAQSGWTIVPFETNMAHEAVDSREIGFRILGAQTTVQGSAQTLHLGTLPTIPADSDLPMTYDAVVSAVSQPVRGEPVLSVLFILEWAEGGG